VIEMEVCDVTGVTCWEYKKGVFVFVSVVCSVSCLLDG